MGVLKSLLEKRRVRLLMKRSKRLLFAALSPFPGLTERIQRAIDQFFSGIAAAPRASNMYIQLDYPSGPLQICSDTLQVSGWAFSLDGPLTIKVLLDNVKVATFQPHFYRADLQSAFPQLQHSHNNAFLEQVDVSHLEAGIHQLDLYFEGPIGREEHIKQSILCMDGTTFYQLWQKAHGPDNQRSWDKKSPPLHILYTSGGHAAVFLEDLNTLIQEQGTGWKLWAFGFDTETLQRIKHSKALQEATVEIVFYESLEAVLEQLKWQEGYFMTLSAREVLRPGALAVFMDSVCNHPEAALWYSDHDVIGREGLYDSPYLTFEWAPDYLLARVYTGRVFIGRNSALQQCPLFSGAGDWAYRLILEMGARLEKAIRIPKMLWSVKYARMDQYSFDEECRAVSDFLAANGRKAAVEQTGSARYIEWEMADKPLVSIIIPTTAKLELIKPCLESIQLCTDYPNYEVIVLDNSKGKHPEGVAYLAQADAKVIVINDDFNWSRFNNIGVQHARGDLLLFLNDDIEVIEPRWLDALAREAYRTDIGAVGALLLYPDESIQHGGIMLVPFGGGAMNLLSHLRPGPDVFMRMDAVVREVSANTGACLMVAKTKYFEVNGFDEKLRVVGNDVDFCLKLRKMGYRNLWTPKCRLTHHESVSRKSLVPKVDEQLMWDKWGSVFSADDPYYHPAFSQIEGHFSLLRALPKAVLPPEWLGPSNALPQMAPSSFGVNLIAYIRAEMGLGEAARCNAKAMAASGVDFGIINFESGNPSSMGDRSWRHKEMDAPRFGVNLIHVNPDHLHEVFEQFPESHFSGRYNIGYWAWELPKLPLNWVASLKHLDEIWVPSRFVQQAVSENASVPVFRMPHCMDVSPDYSITRSMLGISAGVFVFLTMFDPRSTSARKNPDGAINAFMRAFSPTDTHVHLLIKVKEPDTSTLKALEQRLSGWPNIQLVSQACDREQTNALLTLSDCVVSLHRSEGFGLVPAEAMALGKCAILTNWSGNTDYMTPDNCIPIAYSLVELEENYGPYTKGQVWAEPDLDMAAQAMRDISTNPEKAKRMGEAARLHMATYFSPEAIGHRMLSRLQAIAFGVQAS